MVIVHRDCLRMHIYMQLNLIYMSTEQWAENERLQYHMKQIYKLH